MKVYGTAVIRNNQRQSTLVAYRAQTFSSKCLLERSPVGHPGKIVEHGLILAVDTGQDRLVRGLIDLPRQEIQ